jgi:hypothetical protein
VLYGSANYLVSDYPSSGPVIGAAVFAPGANVEIGAPNPDYYTFGSIIQPYGSSVTLEVAGFSVGNVLLGPDSHLTFGNERPPSASAIGNLWNDGGNADDQPE